MTKKRPFRILLSNDDGVSAPGIICLQKALSSIAEVVVVAPDSDRSGASHSLTLSRPLKITPYAPNVFQIDGGTPVDCVHLALSELLQGEPVDFVVSGINKGANLGDDTLYSGTVAAAIEGHFHGLPALAVSLVGECYYETAAHYACQIVEQWKKNRPDRGTIFNMNVPDCPQEEIQGVSITRLGRRIRSEPVHPIESPRGETLYWVGKVGMVSDAGHDTDFHAIRQNTVSVTPLQTDFTAHHEIASHALWVNAL